MNELRKHIDDVLTTAFKREFWLGLNEELSASYLAANETAIGPGLRLGNSEIIRLRPQIRHYTLNAALKRAAEYSGYVVSDKNTNPKGESYVVVESNLVRISRIGTSHDSFNIKKAKHRTLLAELNHEYEGYTPDFFDLNEKNESTGSLGVFIVNVNPPLFSDQSRMLDLRIVVPFTNLKGLHYSRSVSEILELYNIERDNVVLDKAIPVLRKRLKEQEG
ncbi:hypothetical protein HH682_12030 [Rosenbergiella sp. S61]|uniref:Uncharacterized protein n=1 Tax=Rosenbergiella gaditana TaxID=2726987 RepID=A0ABS5T0X1_9GAMM|nr:hypothetical protein [Rosenbergiella gaditana]MBT0725130.1 hypothetical protein [Rosenbergiella gaditana]